LSRSHSTERIASVEFDRWDIALAYDRTAATTISIAARDPALVTAGRGARPATRTQNQMTSAPSA
jgi:hypothetical protein